MEFAIIKFRSSLYEPVSSFWLFKELKESRFRRAKLK